MNERHHHKFDSTRVTEGWYNEKSRVVMVKFPDGTFYRYFDVPITVWNDFIKADSAGRFLNSVLTTQYYGR